MTESRLGGGAGTASMGTETASSIQSDIEVQAEDPSGPVVEAPGNSEGVLLRAAPRPPGVATWFRAAFPHLLIDALAVALAWVLAALVFDRTLEYPGTGIGSPLILGGLVVLVLAGNAARGLYAEAMGDRALELVSCARSCFVAAIVVVLTGEIIGLEPAPLRTAGATVLCFLFLLIARSGYRARITAQRRTNEAVRPTLVVGTNDEAFELCRLLDQDSAFGYRPWGVVGSRAEYDRFPFEPPWLGEVDAVATAAAHFRIDQVFVARTALSAMAFSEMTRQLTSAGIHVAASSGLPSVDQRRLKIMAIAQMPMYCLGAGGPSRREAFVKRGLDIALALLGLVVAAPLMALIALAILVVDGRPILFRQQRVGRNGVPFTIYKFRTMIRDADLKIMDLMERNERQGPLFKLTRDPRATRLGGLLRDSSLDELPQLVNVLQGKMSLVGPRPALVTEAERFSKELLARNGARPGMTGLWQVEAGDDPSFVLYQHLDLYYVDNWSFTLDLAILLATLPTVVWRTFDRLVRARRRVREDQERIVEHSRPTRARVSGGERPLRVESGSAFRYDVAVMGIGRAAVPLGLAFANGGLSVALYDTDSAAVEMVNRGRMPVRGGVERGILRRTVHEGRLRASTDAQVVSGAESVVLVLGAADRAGGQVASTVLRAVESIRDWLRDGQLLVLENSLDPAVAQQVEDLLDGFGLRIDIALSRERLPGGPPLSDFEAGPQILCGRTPEALERAERLFRARTPQAGPPPAVLAGPDSTAAQALAKWASSR